MSEDCHDSNNVDLTGTVSVTCYHCHEAVTPEQAYIFEMQNRDGSSETVVFHGNLDRLCAFRWAVERLENISGRLDAILALMKYVDDGRGQ